MFAVKFTLAILSIAQFGQANASFENSNSESTPSDLTERAEEIVHTVRVGITGNTFDPKELKANVGDIIDFRFYPQNHSVARAPFGYPCIPYEYYDVGQKGFWSGYKPTNAILSNPPNYRVRVNDTAPIFFYCTHADSCLGSQMIGVINPNTSQTLESQIEFVEHTTIKLEPGEPWPSETTGIPTLTPSVIPDHPHAVLSAGAIAGIALGGLCILLLAAALFYIFTRRRAKRQLKRNNFPLPPSYVDGNQTYLNPAHIPSKGIGHEGTDYRTGSYGYPAEADSYGVKSPMVDRSGTVSGTSEIDGTQTSPTRVGSLYSQGSMSTHGRYNHVSMSPLEEVTDQPHLAVSPCVEAGNLANNQSGFHQLDVDGNRRLGT